MTAKLIKLVQYGKKYRFEPEADLNRDSVQSSARCLNWTIGPVLSSAKMSKNQTELDSATLLVIFLISSFYQLSQCSDSAPDVTSLCTNYSSTCYTFCIYTYFPFKVFLMFPTFTCAPIYPSTCFHFSFHVLWLCSRPFLSYYDTLYFYVFKYSKFEIALNSNSLTILRYTVLFCFVFYTKNLSNQYNYLYN